MIRNLSDYWECLTCGKTAKTRQHIKYHAETHLGIRHVCRHCGKNYKTTHSLSVHISQCHKMQYSLVSGYEVLLLMMFYSLKALRKKWTQKNLFEINSIIGNVFNVGRLLERSSTLNPMLKLILLGSDIVANFVSKLLKLQIPFQNIFLITIDNYFYYLKSLKNLFSAGWSLRIYFYDK